MGTVKTFRREMENLYINKAILKQIKFERKKLENVHYLQYDTFLGNLIKNPIRHAQQIPE